MGYDTDTNYNYGYFSLLNPYQTRFNFIARGIAFPKLGPETNACELGFGNGVSLVMHAANSQINWYGNDFNPSQVGFAQELADKANVKVHISDDAFDQFLERDDLPMFDYICLHGIWSWISRENQDVIVDFVKRKLKIGGVLYISYNLAAGFGNVEAFRYLMYTHLNTLGDQSRNHIENIPAAIDFMNKLLEVEPAYTKNAPWYIDSYKARILNHDHVYLGHEFFNDNWILENFNEVAAKFETAKLNFVCQARLFDDSNEFMLGTDDVEILKDLYNTPLYEPARDYVIGQTFRADLYVKGARQLSPKQQLDELDNTYFLLLQDYKNKELVVNTRFGKRSIDTQRIEGILKLLSDYNAHSYQELREALTKEYVKQEKRTKSIKHIPLISHEELLDNIIYAITTGTIMIAQPPQNITPDIVESCQRLNKLILNPSSPAPLHVLSCPYIGGAMTLEDIHKIMLNIILNNKNINEVLLTNALFELFQEGKSLGFSFKLKDREITNPKEHKDILKNFVHNFMLFQLPIIRKICYL